MTTMVREQASCALLSVDLLDLLMRAQESLLAAASASTTTRRYVHAQDAAVRAAAALLCHVAPRVEGARPRNVWEALANTMPEFVEAAEFFSTTVRRARKVNAEIVRVMPREADDLVREAEVLLARVLGCVGLPPMPPLDGLAPVSVR